MVGGVLALLIAATGWTVQGLPLLSYSTDEGLGYGARLLFVDHGTGEEQPYRYAIKAQFYQTTHDVAAHLLSVDAPAFLGSRNRIEVEAAWAIFKFSPYYGAGNASAYVPAYDTCGDRAALAADPDACPGNAQFRGLRFYRYDQRTLPRIRLNLRRDIDGPWKLFAGYRFRLTHLAPLYDAGDLGQHGPSLLMLDGYAGAQEFDRRVAEITGGVVFDTRDNEPAPTEGMFHEASLRSGLRAAGGEFNYWGANATLRFYRWIFTRRLVAAARVLADAAFGDVPFFLLSTTGGLAGPDGLGGGDTVRGLLENRLQGRLKLVANAELRWRFWSGEHFAVETVAGLDGGKVEGSGGMRLGGAAGLRVAWNRDFIVRFDYGIGISEPFADGNVYITFDELF